MKSNNILIIKIKGRNLNEENLERIVKQYSDRGYEFIDYFENKNIFSILWPRKKATMIFRKI